MDSFERAPGLRAPAGAGSKEVWFEVPHAE